MLVLLLFCMSACGDVFSMLIDTGGANTWLNSDIRENYAGVGEIRLQDDYAAAVNREWVTSQTGNRDSSLLEVNVITREREKELLADASLQDADALELKKYAELASDWEYRNAQGVEPLRKYIEPLQALQSKEDVYRWICDTENNPLGITLLMLRQTRQSEEMENTNLAVISLPDLSLQDSNAYTSMENETLRLKLKVDQFAVYLFSRLGYSEKEAQKIADHCYQFEKKLTEAYGYEAMSEEKSTLRFDEMIEAAGAYPMDAYWKACGYAIPEHVLVSKRFVKRLDRLCSDVEGFKAMMMMQYASQLYAFLDRETYDFHQDLMRSPGEKKKVLSAEEQQEAEDSLFYDTYIGGTSIGDIMGKYYIQRYFSQEDHERLETLTRNLLEMLKKDFSDMTWLSEEGRAAAIEKADNMMLHVIAPDYDLVDYGDIHIVSKEDGGSFADAYIQSVLHKQNVVSRRAAEPFDRTIWIPEELGISTMTLNAFYAPQHNGIFICAGILAGIVYESSMTEEEMLAGIGTIIGHEITHGFDANGMTFDKTGNNKNFVPDADLAEFNTKANSAMAYLSAIKPIAGEDSCNGQQIVSEMLADMGGVKICLMLAEQNPDFDYDKFFRCFAMHWARSVDKETEIYYLQGDEHPLCYLRANVSLQQFDRFYETYGVQEGDRMYLAPEKRIAIW